MSEQLSILVVDDHRIFAEGLVAVLRLQFPKAGFEMARSGEEAWEMIQRTPSFHLVITDISMASISGLELASRIKKEYPAIPVLILSMHDEEAMVKSAMNTEAEGFVLKSASAQEIGQAIRDVIDGKTHYSREVMAIYLQEVRKDKKREQVQVALTEREREVLKLILDEYSSEAIAEKLFISRRTVDTHRANILEKTGCYNLIALYKFATLHHLADR
ncbi:MAG: response regulator transcription factor [Cyclobacteriaceae bacterium]|nr:response regulator transcription factor [Cyclobacteriaceae bacterium]